MHIADWHQDFKQKINKVDTQVNPDLRIPEIDWIFNEALLIYIDQKLKLFELNQDVIDDINILVKSKEKETENNIYPLESDYYSYVRCDVYASKNSCKDVKLNTRIVQHNDLYDVSPFDKSSFEFRFINGVFNEKGLEFKVEDFTIDKAEMVYIKKHPYIHYAEGYSSSGYKLPSGVLLTGFQDCILPEKTHRQIIDIAVYLAKSQLQINDLNLEKEKITMNKN